MDSDQNKAAQKRTLRDDKRRCPMCARTFSKTEHLERHIRSHTKEKPFRCQQCGKRYGRNDSLLRHIKDQHNRNNKAPKSQFTSALSTTRPETVTEIINEQQTEITPSSHDTNTTISVLGDLSNMSMGVYHGQPSQIEQVQPTSEASPWQQDHRMTENVFLDGQQTILGFDNWLTCGNLDDSLLRTWPFVIDEYDSGCTRGDTTYSSGNPLADLQQSWYTHFEKDEPIVSGYTSPFPVQNQEVDDNYRQSLHRRLQIRVLDHNLPSADFLNTCVRAYFKRFHPVFPVIHAATFRPSKANAVLLLSICSIGSLLTGHPGAVQRGIQLFERLNKAIVSNWETLMRRGPEENFAMIQAALLGQTFGLLSGQAKHLVLVDTFHGTIIAWARRAKVFQTSHQPSDHQDLETRWREWVHTEEKIRIALAVRIHDAEIANTLHHETFMPLASKGAPVADSDALFFASSPQEWMVLYREEATHLDTPSSEKSLGYAMPESLYKRLLSIPANSQFSIYSALEDILSTIVEARNNETLTNEYVQKLHSCLVTFHRQNCLHDSPVSQFEALRSGIKIFWHFLFISLHADLDLLEKSIGRDGPELSPVDLAKIHQWARSSSAKRTVAHAIIIKRNLEHFPLTSEPAIHVPRALFFSAICFFCYSKYGDGTDEQHLDFPELKVLDIDVSELLREANGYKKGNDLEIGPLCGFVDLLQRIGHWEIARKFASLLGALIHAESS